MKNEFSTILLLLLFSIFSFAQNKKPEDYGFRHFQIMFNGDPVDILIKSKKGEEQKPKPLFLFCQGSLPLPLIVYSEQGVAGTFPFDTDSLSSIYHLIIISKPYIPIIAEAKDLKPDYTYVDSTGAYPMKYSERNLLDYYLKRNVEVLDCLQKQKWVSVNRLVVAGHSEGSTVAAKMAETYPKITHLIYASGNPMGRILSIIQQQRAVETDTDSTRSGESQFEYWEYVVNNKNDMDASQGDTYKATYDFSYPPIEYLEKLSIPVLVCYGTKDWCAPYNDFLRVDMIRKKKTNFSFNSYIGTDHNFFPLLPNGRPNSQVYNWNKVADDWYLWLKNL